MDEQNPKQSGLNVEVPETDLQLSNGSITSDVKLNSGTDNNVDVEQEAYDMDKLSVSNPVKYLVTYNSPREWILDQREAEMAQMIRDTAMPEQASKVGSIAYAAGEFKRKTGNMARDFSEYAAGVDAYLLPNANKDIAERAYKNMKKLSVQTENNRADYVSLHGVDPDVYGIGTNVMEVARDMVLTAGVAGAVKRGATKAAYGYAASRLAPTATGVAERFAAQQGKKAASRAAMGTIAGETFMREAGDRATQQAAQYMDATGDYDLKYYDPTVDLALNTGVSAINSAIEMSLGIERIVPDMLFGTRGVGRAAEEFIKGYISERSEEFLQNFFDQGGDVLSGYRENIDLLQAWNDSAAAGWIGGVFGSGTAAGMYYLNRRRMIRQLQENGIEKDTATKFVDKYLQDGINKTLSNMSSTVELRTKEGPAYDKLKAGIKNALVLQGWNEKMIDPQTGKPMNIDAYVDTLVNKDFINRAVTEALTSGVSIDDWLDVAQFTAIDNVLYVRPLGTVEDIQKRIDEQDAIIKRQTELKKTGADKPSVLQEARTAKAILQKLKANKLLDGEIERVSIEEAKTPEIAKEIDTANTDATELGKANTAADFVGNIEGTDEQKTKRLGNAVMKRIFKDDKRGFDAVMTKPEYANVRAAINSSAAKIFDYIKAHRAYGVAKDLYDALKLLPTVKSGNFISTVNTPDLTGQDPVARNAFLYNFIFNDAHATSAFIDAYLIRAEESITNQTKVRLGKKDLVGQAFKAMDALMQTQADVAGLQYTSIYNEDGSVADPNVAAVVASWQNLFVEVPEQRRLPQRFLEQFDLADENARLDEIYPEYSGKTIVVDGVRRSVFNSEGKRINKSAEALTNFWRWFGNSKAVDKKGRPLVVYHGARGNGNITIFDPQKGQNVEAVYFSKDINVAGHWAEKHVPKSFMSAEKIKEQVSKTANVDELLAIHNRYDYDTLKVVEDKRNKGTFWLEGIYSIELLGEKAGDNIYVNKFGQKTDLAELLRKKIEQAIPDALESDLYSVYMKLENPLIVDAGGKPYWQIDFRGEKVNTESIARFAKENGFDGLIVNNVLETDYENKLTDDYIAFDSKEIKSVENLGYYNAQDPRMLYQIGYASMRGEMVGDFIDANMFAHTGEGPNVHGWGNYFLADKDIDKRRYYDKFNREGPKLKYDGKEINEEWFEQMGITYPETRNIIKYRLQNLSITKKWVLDALERELRSNEERFNASVDNAIARVKDSVGEEKARKIIADIEKMLPLKGGSFISLVVPLSPVAYPEVHKIQKKYFKSGNGLNKDGKITKFADDFVEVYGALYDAFGQEARETSFASAFARDFSELQSEKKSLEAVKKLDFDKFTGRTGFLYKGEDFYDWLEGKLRVAESRHGAWVADAHRYSIRGKIIKAVENAFVHNTTIDEQLNKIEDEEIKPWLDIKPQLKSIIEQNIEKEKSRFPGADIKAVKKFLFDFIDKPDLEKWPTDGMVYQDWYKDESTPADRNLIDAVTSPQDNTIKTPNGETDILIGIINSIREASARKRLFDAAKNALKNAKKEDFLYKPNASMYKTDKIPENPELLDFSKRLNKQPKRVQEGLIQMIEENGNVMPFLKRFLNFQGLQSWDVLDALFDIGDKQGSWNQDLMHNIALKMKSALFNTDWVVRDTLQSQNSEAIKRAMLQAHIEKRDATVRDVVSALEKLNKIRWNESKFIKESKNEQADYRTLRNMSIERISKHGLDTKLTDITDDIRPAVRLADINGEKLYKEIYAELSLYDDAVVKKLRQDPKINATANADVPELTSKLLLKYGIRGVRYWGGTDKRGFVTFEPTQTTQRLYQIAYSGAGVDYNRPSLKAIGTGQNTASHGWGLYYALDPIIAEKYMAESFGRRTSNLSLDQEYELLKVNGKPLLDIYDIDVDRQLLDLLTWKPYGTVEAELDKRIAHWEGLAKDADYKFKDFANKKIDAYKRLKEDLFKNGMSLIKKEQGQVHEVDIPEMDVLLDEQKPLNQQSKKVIEALGEIALVISKNEEERIKPLVEGIKQKLGEEAATKWMQENTPTLLEKQDIAKKWVENNSTGKEIYDDISRSFNKGITSALNTESDKQASLLLDKYGIKGITYYGREDGRCFVIFNDESVKVLRKKFDELGNQLFQGRRATINGVYDPELGTILIGKNFNGTTLPHEMAHYWLDTIFKVFKQAQAGKLNVRPEWMAQKREMFAMLGINENQTSLTRGQQEKFATMLEAYISGVGVTNEITRTFTDYLKWVPEKYRNLQQLSYVDENGKIQNVFLDAKAVEFFNRWYENPSLPSLSTSPERQRFMNVSADDGTVIRVSIKEINDREKEFAQDAEEQLHTDQRLYNTLDENMPAEIKPVADAQKVVISERGNFLKATEEEQKKIITPDDDRKRRWFERKSRETEAQLAQEYIEKNPEHAHEVIFGDPELIPNDTGIDRATLINTYMATNGITEDKPEWAQLHTNIAINQSMAGTQLALSNDKSYRTYLDALREIEEALELKAATNYAGASVGARERFNSDIQQFLSKELPAVFATEAGSKEREIALKQMFEKARTTFSGNTTGRFLTQMDMEYAKAQKRNTDAFVKWAEKVIKTEAGAKLNAEQQAHLLKISAKAQQALTDIDSKDAGVAVAGALELRKWQLEKQKLMGVAPKKFSLFGDYAPRAMLASPNTLLFANIPSTAINTLITNLAKRGDLFGENNVSEKLIKNEIKRIKAIYGSTAMNLAQMEKPTSPTLLHGEKYSASGQKWYDPYTILGREDNLFRVPTFVNTLARIASKDAKATGRSADEVFLEYIKLNDQSDSAKLARKQALAVANMAVFTQNGALARCLNHIRSELNYLSRAPLGLDPHGFGLGSLIAPFLSTGANIAEMGIRGTIAPIVSLTTYAQALRTGKAIDPLKKLALRMDWAYFSLSVVSMALLAALTSGDDEFYIDPYKAGMGYDPDRPYDSINIGGVWVDLDFFGPFAIPMRTAAKVIQAWKKDNGVGTSLGMGYAESAKSVLGDIPLAESIINNQFEWAMKKPGAFASSYAYNQGNKLVPAGIKPISRALSRGQGWMLRPFEGTTVGRKFNRNYGFDGQELTSQDLLEMFTIKFQLGPDAQQYLNNILGLQ